MPNRLADQNSLYLQQHAENPVDWYPWGDEAIEAAQQLNRPILVSIGYSACHWCHVMAHESFENIDTAEYMNQHFVNIKVDREERPDVDAVYMDAVQALGQNGGWPLNVFLTPDLQPYFGGTYWPLEPRQGMPSWRRVLEAMSSAWSADPTKVLDSAHQIVDHMRRSNEMRASDAIIDDAVFTTAMDSIKKQFDATNGGFRGAPKFPTPVNIELLLRLWTRTGDPRALEMASLTLDRMAGGGIYDQLGGGFHRYSVDATWTVPHFEKMLYDNTQLALTYFHGWQATSFNRYRRVVEETLDYLLRDMRSPDGMLYASEDADSEGIEGKFYVWDLEKIRQALGGVDAAIFTRFYGMSDRGNFDGHNILQRTIALSDMATEVGSSDDEVVASLGRSSKTMMACRGRRVRPGRDEKILTDWNALAIAPMILAGQAFERPEYCECAKRIADILLGARDESGGLPHVITETAGGPGFLDDHAFLLEGLIALFECTGSLRWLTAAQELAAVMTRDFSDAQGGFFTTSVSQARILPVRPKNLFDSVTPSGNSSAAMGLLKLAALTGNSSYDDPALRALQLVANVIGFNPLSFAGALAAADFWIGPRREIVIAGQHDDAKTKAMLEIIGKTWMPNTIYTTTDPRHQDQKPNAAIPLLADRELVDGRAAAYVCEGYRCLTPVTTLDGLRTAIGG